MFPIDMKCKFPFIFTHAFLPILLRLAKTDPLTFDVWMKMNEEELDYTKTLYERWTLCECTVITLWTENASERTESARWTHKKWESRTFWMHDKALFVTICIFITDPSFYKAKGIKFDKYIFSDTCLRNMKKIRSYFQHRNIKLCWEKN